MNPFGPVCGADWSGVVAGRRRGGPAGAVRGCGGGRGRDVLGCADRRSRPPPVPTRERPVNDYPATMTQTNQVEPVPRRVRAVLAGETVFDTTRALYVWEW